MGQFAVSLHFLNRVGEEGNMAFGEQFYLLACLLGWLVGLQGGTVSGLLGWPCTGSAAE